MAKEKQVQGMILAAGLGTRLKPFTLHRPKPLLEVLGKPLIYYALVQMHRANVSQIVINTHHLGQQIVDVIGPSFKGIEIHYLHEKNILGTGGALKNAQALLLKNPLTILRINGDTLTDLDFDAFYQFHKTKQAWVTLLLKMVKDPKQAKDTGTDKEDRLRTLVNFVPYKGEKLKQRLFCGTHLIEPEVFKFFPKEDEFSIIDAFYAPLIRDEKPIFGFEQNNFYSDIGTPENLFQANMDILENKIKFASHNFFEDFKEKKPGIWVGKKTRISQDAKIIGPVVIDDEVEIASKAVIGPRVVIGKRVKVGVQSKISSSVVMSDTQIPSNQTIHCSILDCFARESVKL